MTVYRNYVRRAKKAEAALAANLSALKRKQAKLRNDLEAEQDRCNRFIRAKQAGVPASLPTSC